MEYAIEMKDVTKSYTNFKLDHLNLQVPKGCIMGFVGENGAGKTTTIKTLLNLVKRDCGEISILGMNNVDKEKEIKEQVGVVFSESHFHDNLRTKDIPKIMKKIYKSWDDQVFEHYRKEFDLPPEKIMKEYSRGMSMKIQIAVALSHHAKLLILDEATSGLDPVVRDEMLDIFMNFIQDEEHTVFISSHITSDLEKIADYITFIHKGELVFSEPKDELLYNFAIVRCSKEEYAGIDEKYIVGMRKSQFCFEVLIRDKSNFEKEYRQLQTDRVNIEDIILYKVKGVL